MVTRRLTLLVHGEPGEGKSTFLNLIADKPVFRAEINAETVTKEISDAHHLCFQGYDLALFDTPGMNDSEISFEEWHKMLRNRCNSVDVLCFVRRINSRITSSALHGTWAMTTFLENFEPANTVLVLSHCDEVSSQTEIDREIRQMYQKQLKWKSAPIVLHTDMTRSSVLPLSKFLGATHSMCVRTEFLSNVFLREAKALLGTSFSPWESTQKKSMEEKLRLLEMETRRCEKCDQEEITRIEENNKDLKLKIIGGSIKAILPVVLRFFAKALER
eukprot:CAMPEP_0114987182 /NCGR_PEP_ID=MMETSP0216-20121206/8859_1 /TAXON_ID=223996 /ORGANISM="Protocruzia adherens, Strain Boccale" /LENGTH=273 /DNA_ID=CAMNT_0002349739 /DNA_START=99 /DNA_END=920 /DNA_ORIENTATION=+